MKTIVIPASSSQSAVQLFRLCQQLYLNEPVTCWFLEIRPMPSDYNALLTIGRQSGPPCVFDDAFCKEIELALPPKNTGIQYFIDHIYGDSPYVFRNYLKYREVDLVMYDKRDWQNSRKEKGLNIFRMVSQSGHELVYVSENAELVSKGEHIGTAMQQVPANSKAPAGVQYQYHAVQKKLDLLENNFQESILSVKLSSLSRYFLKETSLQKLLVERECSMVLVRK